VAQEKKNAEAADARAEKLRAEVEAKDATIAEKDTYIKTMQARIHFLSQKLTKVMSRHASGSALDNKLRSTRQKQLLQESATTVDSGGLPPAVGRTTSAPSGSRLLSSSFQNVRLRVAAQVSVVRAVDVGARGELGAVLLRPCGSTTDTCGVFRWWVQPCRKHRLTLPRHYGRTCDPPIAWH
jgi:hypothetical protein